MAANVPIELIRAVRTVFFCTKRGLSMRQGVDVIELQSLNGITFGLFARTRFLYAEMLTSIAHHLDNDVRDFIVKKQPAFSLTVDGWREPVGTENLIIVLRFMRNYKMESVLWRRVFLN